MSEKQSYKPYYLDVINAQLGNSAGFNGLKLVVGPTGMGKTNAIPQAIKEIRSNPQVEKRCVYTTHRHMLLEEMGKILAEQQIPSVYLKKDNDLVEDFVQHPKIKDFLKWLDEKRFFDHVGDEIEDSHKRNNVFKRVKRQVDDLVNLFKQLRIDNSLSELAKQERRRYIEKESDQLMNVFKRGLGQISFRAKKQKNQQLAELHAELTKQETLFWELFPYIRFLNDNDKKPVLLVTISKLLHGYFDGHRNNKILSLENNIIFLDEFDMQETEMLKILCQSAEIQNSFEFVGLFAETMLQQEQLGNLEPINNEMSKPFDNAKKRAKKVVNTLQEECVKNGFNFPQIRQFRVKPSEFDETKNLSVFQSNVIILDTPFFLLDKQSYWQVVKHKNLMALNARKLFYTVFRTADDILSFFSELWIHDLKPESDSWIALCYDKKNDEVAGQYKKLIREHQFFRLLDYVRYKMEYEQIKDSIYYQGYNFFRLGQGKYHTDPEQVKIDQKKLTVSPEYILWRLCQSNLVFALSATGDIKREVSAFDLNWLSRYCNYLAITDFDKNLVTQLKEHKETQRHYQINLERAELLNKRSKLCNHVEKLQRDYQFFHEYDDSTSKKKKAIMHRTKALSLFLETVNWVVTKSANEGHLVFMNSFRFAEKFLKKDEIIPPHFYDDIESELKIVTSDQKREYAVTVQGQLCQVIFFDAEKARELGEKSFEQKWAGVPLIVVTTYNTASNGVNLKWVKYGQGKGGDFEGIHLLEARHFYLTDNREDDKKTDYRKIFIWYMWKLYHNHQISEYDFITAIRQLNISQWNEQYKNTTDYMLNQIALFYQALGRVDRQWEAMPTMDVRLAEDVIDIFNRYLNTGYAIGKMRHDRESYTSTLILKIHEALQEKYIEKQLWNELENEPIISKQDRCKRKISELLGLIEEVKQGVYSLEDSLKITGLWYHIREAVLEQDYHFKQNEIHVERLDNKVKKGIKVDFMQDFVLKTAFLQPDDIVYIDQSTQAICRHKIQETTYWLNWPYRNIDENEIIKHYFRARNFKMSYHQSVENLFFTPYAMQQILAGAIGEMAIKALLESKQIPLVSDREITPTFFEMFDMQIAGLPIYIDAKNWHGNTKQRLSIEYSDPDYDEDFNSDKFLKHNQRKWHKITTETNNPNTKLVIINLVGGNNEPNEGFDQNLNKVYDNYAASAIFIIQGAIYQNEPNRLKDEFVSWINQVKAQLS